MSTMSTITYYDKNSKRYYTVYCHCDGYLSGVGLMLYNHYKDYDKVKRLVRLGGMSCVKPNIDPAPGESHSFAKPQKDVCVFYTRDRGEDWEYNQPRVSTSLSGVLNYSQEFDYLFKDGKWLVWAYGSWEPLEQKLLACDLIKNDPDIMPDENAKNSVDIATASDYVTKINTVDINRKAVKFIEMLHSIAKNTSGEILDVCFDKDSNVNVFVDFDMNLTYDWDSSMIDFLKQLLDLFGLKADSFELRIKDNNVRYYSIIGIESK